MGLQEQVCECCGAYPMMSGPFAFLHCPGKTRLGQALSGEIGSNFYCVSSSDLLSSWVGESEK